MKTFKDFLKEQKNDSSNDGKEDKNKNTKEDSEKVDEGTSKENDSAEDKKKNCNESRHILEAVERGSMGGLRLLIDNLETIRRQAQTSHWNIKGDDFITLHRAFDEVYGFAQDSIDRLAERFLAVSIGTNETIKIFTTYQPTAVIDKISNINLMVGVLNTDSMVGIMKSLDPVTENMVQEIIAELDKHKWFIDSSR